MELRTFTNALRRWWWLIIAAVAVAAVTSFFVTRATPKTYMSRTTLQVGQLVVNPNPNAMELGLQQSLARLYADLALREPVLQSTLDALKLTDWHWEWLRDRVTSRPDSNAPILEISVVDEDPQRAKIFAEEISRQLIAQAPPELDSANQAFIIARTEKLRTQITAAEEESRKLDESVAAATSRREIEEIRNRQAALQSQISSWESTYANLLQIERGSPNSIRVLERPAAGTLVGPRVAQNVLLAALVGLALALGAIVLFELIDDTLKTTEDARKTLSLPVLGSVARFGSGAYNDRLVTASTDYSRVAEAYRVLRTNLQFSAIGQRLNVLMITSSKPKEGKSTTAANLAAVIAQSGKRVILVDADLRRPVQHLIFELDNEQGLTTAFLDENGSVSKYLKPVTADSLSVLPSGPIPHNPAELLDSQRMVQVIDALKKEADLVIVDSPPVLSVADATILASRVDGVLMVVDSGYTRRGVAKRAKETLQGIGANILGVVVNRAAVRSESDYYYDYSYASETGEKKKKRRKAAAAPVSAKPQPAPAGAPSNGALKPVKLSKPAPQTDAPPAKG
jgi:non-specific protein-tyrosine kinase